MTTEDEGGITPSQTVGPYYAYGLTPTDYDVPRTVGDDLTAPGLEGRRIRLEGVVTDGDGQPVEDAMIEIWQADAQGRYPGRGTGANAAFTGFGRAESKGGAYAFTTIMPGAPPDDPAEAPHLKVVVFARGLVTHLFTRAYFEGEPRNDHDATLAVVPAERRHTLVATRAGDDAFRFDIRLQGADETVFFRV